MKTNEWQVQVCKMSKSKNGILTQELPTFILPELLGICTVSDAIATVKCMFDKSNISGTIMDSEYNVYTV